MLNWIKKYLQRKVVNTVRQEWPNINRLNNGTLNATIGKNVKLYPNYRLTNCSIGDYTYLAEGSRVSNATIGKFCSIGPNFSCGWGVHPVDSLSTSPMFYSTLKQNGLSLTAVDKIQERKPINIGNDVFIGMNVTILDGVTIGDGAVIGAGAVVSKDIPPYAIAVGIPIEIKKYRFTEDIIKDLLKIRWWDFEESNLQEIERYFFDPEAFIKKHLK